MPLQFCAQFAVPRKGEAPAPSLFTSTIYFISKWLRSDQYAAPFSFPEVQLEVKQGQAAPQISSWLQNSQTSEHKATRGHGISAESAFKQSSKYQRETQPSDQTAGPVLQAGLQITPALLRAPGLSALLEVLRILVLVTSPLPAVPSCSPNPGAFPRRCSASGAVPSLVPGMLTIATKLCSVLKPSSAPTCPAPPHSTRGSRGSRGGFALPRAASSKGRASRGPDPAQNTEQLQPRHCRIPEALPTALCTVLLFLVAAA